LAIYHCSVKIISRSQGRSATGSAAYRSGEKIHDKRSNITHDYTRKGNIDHTEILAPVDTPNWVYQREQLWNEVELCEKRKDSQLCREIEVALPVELTPEQSQQLVKGFIQDEFVSKGMIADLAIHHAGDENPHAHILLTTREITPDGFGKKNRDWNHKDMLESWRVSWERHANLSLEQAGHDERIDHRTLDAQGIDRIPQIHVGAKVMEMEQRGIRTERGAQAISIEETNQKIIQLQEFKEAVEHERHIEIEKSQDRGRTRERDRTSSAGTSDSRRPNNRTPKPTTEREHGTRQDMDRSSNQDSAIMGDNHEGLERRSDRVDQRGKSIPESDKALETDTGDDLLDQFNHTYSGATDRILALARSTDHDKGRDHMDRTTNKPIDRTYLAARRQLNALNCDKYEIGIRNRDGKMMIRSWSQEEVLKSVGWLKRENAKGADIYVRPEGEQNQGIVLVDDLSHGQLERMKSTGFEPAAVIETSPRNFQAWVRLSKDEITPEVATAASKGLANHFEADPNSADWRHFGRLAGFTNRKPEHTTAQNRNPWVLCHESSGRSASKGDETVEKVSQIIIDRKAARERETRFESAIEASEARSRYDPIRTYQNNLKSLTAHYGADMDLSRADFMICSNMAMQGYSKKQITEALQQASPELPTRKAGHELDYCQRTVEAVYSNPKVQEHIKNRQRETGFSR